MKLYDIPRGSKLLLPIDDGKNTKLETCTFHRLDGMYSVIETAEGHIVHLSVVTPVKKVDGHYEIDGADHA